MKRSEIRGQPDLRIAALTRAALPRLPRRRTHALPCRQSLDLRSDLLRREPDVVRGLQIEPELRARLSGLRAYCLSRRAAHRDLRQHPGLQAAGMPAARTPETPGRTGRRQTPKSVCPGSSGSLLSIITVDDVRPAYNSQRHRAER